LQKNTFKSGISFDYYLTNQNLGILRDSHVSTPRDYEAAMNTPVPFYSGKFSYDIDNPRQLVEHHLAKFLHLTDSKTSEKYLPHTVFSTITVRSLI
jgi:iron complex outermembrane receptor protein